MAGSISYLYDPNQDVYVIDTCDDSSSVISVIAGTVIRVNGTVLVSETTLTYDIRLDGNIGTKTFEEADVFTDLASAVTEYQSRLAA